MDRKKAIRLLKSGEDGVRKWNASRAANPGVMLPDLSEAVLHEADLRVHSQHQTLKEGFGKYLRFLHAFFALNALLLSPLPHWLPRFTQPSFLVLAAATLWSFAEYLLQKPPPQPNPYEFPMDASRDDDAP
jgi:hypothetical protein